MPARRPRATPKASEAAWECHFMQPFECHGRAGSAERQRPEPVPAEVLAAFGTISGTACGPSCDIML